MSRRKAADDDPEVCRGRDHGYRVRENAEAVLLHECRFDTNAGDTNGSRAVLMHWLSSVYNEYATESIQEEKRKKNYSMKVRAMPRLFARPVRPIR